MENTIIFNHIPRTGGTTLRVILNRVYGESRVFFINSRKIPASLVEYNNLNHKEQAHFKVISGHGALHFHPQQGKEFNITVLREPVSLFLSQYHYLRESTNSSFLEEVKALSSFEDYMNYAIEHGQDNMMVRCLDPENQQFTLDGAIPPDMKEKGEAMLQRAIISLDKHDMVMDLENFDKDLYSLAHILGWKRIPMYRQLNKASYSGNTRYAVLGSMNRLIELLRFDIELYRYFVDKKRAVSSHEKHGGPRYRAFLARQRIIRLLFSK